MHKTIKICPCINYCGFNQFFKQKKTGKALSKSLDQKLVEWECYGPFYVTGLDTVGKEEKNRIHEPVLTPIVTSSFMKKRRTCFYQLDQLGFLHSLNKHFLIEEESRRPLKDTIEIFPDVSNDWYIVVSDGIKKIRHG